MYECDPFHIRRDLREHLQPLADHCEFVILEASHVASRPRQARDEAAADGIDDNREHDGDGVRLLQECGHDGSRASDNDLALQSNKFFGRSLEAIRLPT
jgi:hypothetical protein